MKNSVRTLSLFILTWAIYGCNYNPLIGNNHTTGDPAGAVIGAGVGAGTVALAGGSKPFLWLGGITGGMFGYYITTLRADAADIIAAGGQVYKVGDYVGVYIPSDQLFAANTAELLPTAYPILESAATVLKRYPNNNILISGNTSGFYCARWEQRLSERRARVVSAFLWKSGVGEFKTPTNDLRKLNYVGYGDYFPIASHYTNKGIRANSRVQITSYPSNCDLMIDKRSVALRNMGDTDETYIAEAPYENCPRVDENGRCLGADPLADSGFFRSPLA